MARESILPFLSVPAAALNGRAPWTMARNILTLAQGTLAARRLIEKERPDAILGTGGYVCVPVFLAARAASVPTVLYLPDVKPGLAVRFLARLATVVACDVEDSIGYLGLESQPSRYAIVGYPTRAELFEQDRAECRAAFGLMPELPVLLVYGGSRGARSINKAVAALLEHLLPLTQIIHICGREGDEHFLREAATVLPAELQERYKLYPYLHSDIVQPDNHQSRRPEAQKSSIEKKDDPARSMTSAFGAADLVLCRSGASTLGELPAAGLPAVLVPYPFVHQEENADFLVRHGAAVKVRDQDMLGDGQPDQGPLFRQLRQLIVDTQERASMAQRSMSLARPDAARRLAGLVLDLAARRQAI